MTTFIELFVSKRWFRVFQSYPAFFVLRCRILRSREIHSEFIVEIIREIYKIPKIWYSLWCQVKLFYTYITIFYCIRRNTTVRFSGNCSKCSLNYESCHIHCRRFFTLRETVKRVLRRNHTNILYLLVTRVRLNIKLEQKNRIKRDTCLTTFQRTARYPAIPGTR